MKKHIMKLLVAIVDRGKGERIVSICREQRTLMQTICLGHGTASSEVLDLLGLGRTEKAVVLTLVPDGEVPELLKVLADRMQILGPGNGIAFTVPLSSIGAVPGAVQARFEEQKEKEEAPTVEPAIQKDLILVTVEQGHADDVMEAARPVGARGGTVLHARDVSGDDTARFFGISIHPEREIVARVVTRELRSAVMQAISKAAGPQTPAQGVLLSIPVDEAVGMR